MTWKVKIYTLIWICLTLVSPMFGFTDCHIWKQKYEPSDAPLERSDLSMESLISWCVSEENCRAISCEITADSKECDAWPWLAGDSMGVAASDLKSSLNHITFNVSCQYEYYESTWTQCLYYFKMTGSNWSSKTYTDDTLPGCYEKCRLSKTCTGFSFNWQKSICHTFKSVSWLKTDAKHYDTITSYMDCFKTSDWDDCLQRKTENTVSSYKSYLGYGDYNYKTIQTCINKCSIPDENFIRIRSGQCSYTTLADGRCHFYHAESGTKPNIYQTSASLSCYYKMKCPTKTYYGKLYGPVVIACKSQPAINSEAHAGFVWKVDNHVISGYDPLYRLTYDSKGDSLELALEIKNLTSYEVAVDLQFEHENWVKNLTFQFTHRMFIVAHASTEPLSGDYEITSFGSTVISDAVTYRKENRIIALNKDFGVDGDVGTCAQSRNTDLSEAYFRVGFEEEFFIHTVDLYQIFYNTWPGKKDWHYGDCWLNSTKLEECISEENDVTVLVQSCEESGTCVDVEECQAVTFTSGTEQKDQIYSVTCDSVGNSVSVRGGSGKIVTVCELRIFSYPQDCPSSHYLAYPTFMCQPCSEGYTSTPYPCAVGQDCDIQSGVSSQIYKCTTTDGIIWEPVPANSPFEKLEVSITTNDNGIQIEDEMSLPLLSPDYKYNYPGDDANDMDLTTFARTKGNPNNKFIEIKLENSYYVAYITLYFPFYTSKFYDPEPRSVCLNSLEEYNLCLNSEKGSKLEFKSSIYSSWSELTELDIIGNLTQTERTFTYEFYDVAAMFRLVNYNQDAVIRLSEVVVATLEPNCTGNYYITKPFNICVKCRYGFYSYGGSARECSADRSTIHSLPWDVYGYMELEDGAIPLVNTTASSSESTSFETIAYHAVDRDLGTFFETIEHDAENGPTYFSFRIYLPPSDIFIHEVVINLLFLEDWFYFPDHHCLTSQSAYRECKDAELGTEVMVMNSAREKVASCGTIITNYGLSFEDQTYRITCDVVGREVMLKQTSNGGVIRITSFFFTTREQNCTGNHYLKKPENVCVKCDSGYSYGGMSVECVSDRTLISTSPWVTTAIEGEITVMAVTQYSNLTGNYHGPEYATDKDLSTFSLVEADGSAGGPWFKIDLSQPHLLDRVVIFLMFFNDWYYFPDNLCLLSYDSYQICKDSESGLEVALYDTEDNLVKTCGVLAVSDSVNHEGQIYSFTCSAIGKYLLLNKSGAGTIRILEIVVTSRGQDCPPNHFLASVTNLCVACVSGLYSYGGRSPQCTVHRTELSASMWSPMKVEGEIIAVSVSQSHSAAYSAQYSTDQDCTTFSLAEVSGGEVWFKLEYSHPYFLHEVVVYLLFYEDWFYFPLEDCLLSESNYTSCKDDEAGVDIGVYEGDRFVKSCGTLTPSHDLSQSGQIYKLSCAAIGDTVVLNKTSGVIRLSEIIVNSMAQECPGGRHLNISDNICYPCPANTFSPGGSTSECAACPYMSQSPADTATSSSDCQTLWSEPENEDYLGYVLQSHSLQLRLGDLYSDIDGQYGNVSLALHDRGEDVTEIVGIEWNTHLISVTNLCNDTSSFQSPGFNQTIMISQLADSFYLTFVRENGTTLTIFSMKFSECKEGMESYSNIFKFSIEGLNARQSQDCVALDPAWEHATTDALPVKFNGVFKVDCIDQYFNLGDKEVTCIGDNSYVHPGHGPSCQPGPYQEEDGVQLHVADTAAWSPISGSSCGNMNLAVDNSLETCAGAFSEEIQVMMEVSLDKTRYVNNVIIYTLFYDSWYNLSDPCVQSLAAYDACKTEEAGVDVDLYLGATKVGRCGTIETESGTLQNEQIHRFACNAEGNSIRLSKDSGYIKVYEVVVTSLDCGLLRVDSGLVSWESEYNHVFVTCFDNHQFHGSLDGRAACINGTWTPTPMCLPSCAAASTQCSPGQTCKMLHDIPLCFSGCGDPTAPLNGTIKTYNASHATIKCDTGFHVEGPSIVTCHQKSGVWKDGPWCIRDLLGGVDLGGVNVVLSMSEYINVTRLLKLKRWTFTSKCPKNYIVKSCQCHQTESFPFYCEGAALIDGGRSCEFFNSQSNNVLEVQGLALCVQNVTIEEPCDFNRTLQYRNHVTSEPSHHPHLTCHLKSHPTPEACWLHIVEGDTIQDWKGFARSSGEVDLEQDGSCSVNCFDAGMGKCVLTMLCSAKGLLSDSVSLRKYKLETCPTCAEVKCRILQFCAFRSGSPTCHNPCPVFSLRRGHATFNGSHAVVSCDERMYYAGSTSTLECLPQGRWEPKPRSCVYYRCLSYSGCQDDEYCREAGMDPPPAVHSSYPFDNRRIPTCFKRCPTFHVPHATVTNDNQFARTFCARKQFKFTGAHRMKCLSNGTWSKEVPTCEPRFCDVAKCAEHQFCLEIDGLAKCRDHCPTITIENGEVVTQEHPASVACNPGYFVHGEKHLECQVGSVWSTETPSCHLRCPEVPEFPAKNGSQEVTLTKITTTCNSGYTLFGEGARGCQSNGSWSGAPSNCQPSSCNGVKCSMYHMCVLEGGIAVCAPYTMAEFKINITKCLGNIKFTGNCDGLLSDIEKRMSKEEYVDALTSVVYEMDLVGSTQPYLLSRILLQKLIPIESSYSQSNKDAIVKVVSRCSDHVASLYYSDNKEVLVGQCMLLVNSLVRNLQSRGDPTNSRDLNRKNWQENTKKRSHEKDSGGSTMFNTGQNSEMMLKLKVLSENLVENLKDKDEL